jgi:hypothetical protein
MQEQDRPSPRDTSPLYGRYFLVQTIRHKDSQGDAVAMRILAMSRSSAISAFCKSTWNGRDRDMRPFVFLPLARMCV